MLDAGLIVSAMREAGFSVSSAPRTAIPLAQRARPAAVRPQKLTVSRRPMKHAAFTRASRRSSSAQAGTTSKVRPVSVAHRHTTQPVSVPRALVAPTISNSASSNRLYLRRAFARSGQYRTSSLSMPTKRRSSNLCANS